MTPPITASICVLKPSSLFAGKMHAVLFRNWKNRVKGRDFYDLLWYLGQKIPMKLSYLEQKMHEGGTLQKTEKLTREKVSELLQTRLKAIDWENAKKDAIGFIQDPREVDAWDAELFLNAVDGLEVVP